MSATDLTPFDPLAAGTVENPHEVFAQLRRRCPVARSERWEGFWLLTRYRDIVKAATRPDTFTSTEGIVVPRNPVSGRRAPMHFDPPEHTRYRRAMNAVFREERVREREPAIRALARARLAGLVAGPQPWELVRNFASPFTCEVLAAFLGLEAGDAAVLQEHTQRFEEAQVALDTHTAEHENQFMYAMARRIVAAREAAPRDPQRDLISRLLATAADHAEPAEFVAGSVRQLFVAAHVAPTVAIAAAVAMVMQEPGLEQRLRAQPELIPEAIEEILRLATPNQGFSRTTTAATRIGAQGIAAGEQVVLCYPAGNRDPEVFDEPDRFVLGRAPNKHLAFGAGVHKCVGAPLARLELRVALEELLGLTADLRVAGKATPFPWPMLGPATLPIRTSPAL